MDKKEMKKILTVVNAVRDSEKRDNSRTSTLASIIEAMTVIEQAEGSYLNLYLLDDSSYVSESRICIKHPMDAEEKETHLLRVMQALLEYDEE